MILKPNDQGGRRNTLARIGAYAAAAAMSACAVWLTTKLLPTAHDLAFLLPISVVAVCVYFGTGPAVLATTVGAVGITYLILDPVHSFRIHEKSDLARLGFFLISCVMTILAARFVTRWGTRR